MASTNALFQKPVWFRGLRGDSCSLFALGVVLRLFISSQIPPHHPHHHESFLEQLRSYGLSPYAWTTASTFGWRMEQILFTDPLPLGSKKPSWLEGRGLSQCPSVGGWYLAVVRRIAEPSVFPGMSFGGCPCLRESSLLQFSLAL